ncbi:carbohydrate kinase family protein [Aureimonas sp. ME7]|uniref:carbohydrate kinase family protein n=1 Tax=Aureimonas sp. ME7 TaxID=2744252 RepID=UPI0015FE46E8|nr:carbohydrate kinase family protein [Aureimonas sp. ME7]
MTVAPRILIAGYLSLDEVTQASGETFQQAGGAALYAALGARQLGADVDLCASVGDDFPAGWIDALQGAGIGLPHVARRAGPSRWTRIIHAADGTRRSKHFADPRWWEAGRDHAPRPPGDLSGYDAVVACPMPSQALSDLLEAAARAGRSVIADLSEAYVSQERQAILALVPNLAVLAPSREETRLVLPGVDDAAAARHLAALGPAVVQKRGAEGAFCVEAGRAAAWIVPAPGARVLDPTGAGDATVGALAAAWVGTRDLVAAVPAALTVGAHTVSGHGASALCGALAPTSTHRISQGASSR